MARKETTDWFGAMAAAVNDREKALNGLARWTKRVADAEAAIEKLTVDRETQETLPPAARLEEEVAKIPPAFQPVFGISTPVNQ